GSLGIAIMGAIVASYAHTSPGRPPAPEDFVTGFQHALEVAAGIAFIAAIVAVLTVRRYRHAERGELAGVGAYSERPAAEPRRPLSGRVRDSPKNGKTPGCGPGGNPLARQATASGRRQTRSSWLCGPATPGIRWRERCSSVGRTIGGHRPVVKCSCEVVASTLYFTYLLSPVRAGKLCRQ